MFGRAPESPGLPENTGSAPATFAPVAQTIRPIPDYPRRADYAIFDPASSDATEVTIPSPQGFPRANIASMVPSPALIEQRAGSEPLAGWWRLNAVIDGRHASIPPALETASLTFRERMCYPDRTIDEITDYMSPPIVEPQSWVSEAIMEEARSDWGYGWPEENEPSRTRWMGYDNSSYARYGGWDAPDETAALANEHVAQSIEIESDPLVALRQSAHDSQVVIRRELERRIRLEDRNGELEEMVSQFENNEDAFERSQRMLMNRLELAETEREQFRTERDVAQRQNVRLRLQVNEPESESSRRQAQDRAITEARQRDTGLRERIQALEQSERNLTHRVQCGTQMIHRLVDERGEMGHHSEQLESERTHYQDECEQQRDMIYGLQAQVHALTAQLVATHALQVQLPINQTPVGATSNSPPPVVHFAVTTAATGSASGERSGPGRGGRRGRAGRGGRGATTAVRRQPKRSCKVEKSYRK